ncbi:MAG: hypothetical protein IJZ95_05060 [Oscillospiraceae bacterium]|nr:hypothetical protein [Oscillospiraceae bacterium]
MKKSTGIFLKNAVILTLALLVVIIFMPEWGVAQVIIVLLIAILAAGQWVLWAYMRKTK